jgi:Zn-dependent peptidase ImmA (M78 family)
MTFAHELGHLVLHAGVLAKPRMALGNESPFGVKPYESAEWQARKFAAFFLMPTHIAKDFSSAYELAESCKISAQAAKIKFDEVGHLRARRTVPECVQNLRDDLQTNK